MDRVAVPLVRMGASLSGQGPRCLPPLRVTGGPLIGIDYRPPMASAQVKSAVLLAGLGASGETIVREVVPTRTHTEDMLAAAGADVTVVDGPEGRIVRLRPGPLRAVDTAVPGDPSQAAFWVVGALVAGGQVRVPEVYVGPDRAGFLAVLARMGGAVELVERRGDVAAVVAARSALEGTDIAADEIPSLDEVPILAVAAAVATGTTRFHGVAELRVKESDRLAGTVRLLGAFGAEATSEGDDLIVRGGARLHGGRFDAAGDHRMAMAAAVAGVAAGEGEETVVAGWSSVLTSYPRFAEDLARLTGSGR